MDRDWIYERCKEVDAAPWGHIDLWSRFHYKSTIITFAGTIQEIISDPSVTVGIFSHTRPIAKGFMRQIKREFEDNERLKALFPEILWQNPKTESPSWSEDNGIIVRRSNNPKESTVEAWGLVDGQPTSKHFDRLFYDDIVTRESVTSPDMIRKVTEAFSLSLNLGHMASRRAIAGTRYHYNDSYKTIMDRGTAVPRIYPATDDGTVEGNPVLLTDEELVAHRRDLGSYVFGCQMLQDPKADEAQGFDLEWVRPWSGRNWDGMNLYVLVDPSSGKKTGDNDYTTIQVIGVGEDENFYWIDGLRDRLNLTQRGDALMRMHREYRPKGVAYEEYGMQADIDYVKTVQEAQNYRFEITPVKGSLSKQDRIRRLVPVMEQGRFYMPPKCQYKTQDGEVIDVVHEFRMELDAFPVGAHDDLIDGAARILDKDLGAVAPKPDERKMGRRIAPKANTSGYNPLRRK